MGKHCTIGDDPERTRWTSSGRQNGKDYPGQCGTRHRSLGHANVTDTGIAEGCGSGSEESGLLDVRPNVGKSRGDRSEVQKCVELFGMDVLRDGSVHVGRGGTAEGD